MFIETIYPYGKFRSEGFVMKIVVSQIRFVKKKSSIVQYSRVFATPSSIPLFYRFQTTYIINLNASFFLFFRTFRAEESPRCVILRLFLFVGRTLYFISLTQHFERSFSAIPNSDFAEVRQFQNRTDEPQRDSVHLVTQLFTFQ